MLERRLSDVHLDNSSLRSVATSLATLLIDGKISVVQPLIQEKFYLLAPNQKQAIEYSLANKVHTFVAPPSNIASKPTVPAGLIMVDSEPKKDYLDRLSRGADVKWNHQVFLKQNVIAHRNKTACRRDIIQFVRNVRGGSHFTSAPKKPAHKLLSDVATLCTVERPFDQDPKIKMGGSEGARLSQIPLDPHLEIDIISVELLSMASRLVTSPCTRKLYEALAGSDA
ncbi:MAG: hypothetical protein ABJM39_09560 [Porticoccus sp.]|uniref:hypothetical protein n=1 Tax=Porticoccus sp. TaxID=2024853 RepID=UPI00329A6690